MCSTTRFGRRLPAGFLALLLGLLVPPTRAWAVGQGGYSMEILVDGAPLAEHSARESVYVEARRGHGYSIRLSNHTSRRVAVSLSVDGLNTIDARRTTAGEARKWILRPYETITLDGWQTSGTTARRFIFTTEPQSYGAWLGKTDDLGVITAAFFRERGPIVLWNRPSHDPWRGDSGQSFDRDRAEREEARPGEPLAAPGSASEPSAGADHSDARAGGAGKDAQAGNELSPDYAATGIGEQVAHSVQQVAFDHEDSPAAVLAVRYEYHDALVRLGVLPAWDGYRPPLDRRERARGFEEPEWAPDPYDWRGR